MLCQRVSKLAKYGMCIAIGALLGMCFAVSAFTVITVKVTFRHRKTWVLPGIPVAEVSSFVAVPSWTVLRFCGCRGGRVAREGRAAGAGFGNTIIQAESVQFPHLRGGGGSNRRPPDVGTGAVNMPRILSSGGSGQGATRKPTRGRKRGSGGDRSGLSASGPRSGGSSGDRFQGADSNSGRAEAGGGGKRSRMASRGGGAGGAVDPRGPAQRQHDTLADAPNLQMKVTFPNPVRTAISSSELARVVHAALEHWNLAHGSVSILTRGPSPTACSKKYTVSLELQLRYFCWATAPSPALCVTTCCTMQH